MKGICPVQTSLDWLSVKDVLGNDNAWKIWMASKEGELPEPVKAAFYLFTESDPVTASTLLETHIPFQTKAKFNLSTPILEMIESASDKMFQEEEFKLWTAEKEYLDKLFEGEEYIDRLVGGKIKRTKEKQDLVSKEEQTIEELASEKPGPEDLITSLDPVDISNKIHVSNIIFDYINKFGSKYTTITSEEAKTLLTGSATPYNGDAVFYHVGTNYFVQDKLNINTNFHEIALPIIQTLRKSDRASYDKIVTRLLATPIGQKLVSTIKTNNPRLVEKSEVFTDKLIVAALKQDAVNKSINKSSIPNSDPITVEFNNVIGEIMFRIKPILRIKFNKLKTYDLTKLDSTTSLTSTAKLLIDGYSQGEELTAKVLIEANSELDTKVNEILAAVKDDTTKDGKRKQAVDNIIHSAIDATARQLLDIKAKPFWDIAKELSDENSNKLLVDIKERLREFGKNISPEKTKHLNDLDLSFKARALVSSLFTLKKVIQKINDYMTKIETDPEAKVVARAKAVQYEYLLKHWEQFTNITKQNLTDAGIDPHSSLYNLVTGLGGDITNGLNKSKLIQNEVAVDFITEELKDAAKPILDDLDKEIARLRTKSGENSYRDKLIKNLQEKKEKYTFTKSKVNMYFRGDLGDSHFMSSMFESYITNPDPIIAGFARFLKRNLAKINNQYIDKQRAFMHKINPMMEKLGMDPADYKKTWGEFIDTDNRVTRDENDKLTRQAVLGFHAPVRDFRFKKAELREAIEVAKLTGDRDTIIAAYNAEDDELQARWNREFTREYYEVRKEFIKKNPEAYAKKEDIDRRIRDLRNQYSGDLEVFENNDAFTVLEKEKRNLSNEYNEDGTLKSDVVPEGRLYSDRQIAKDLAEYKQKNAKFYKSIEKPGAFQRAFESFISAKLATEPALQNEDGSFTDEFTADIKEWLRQNTIKRNTQLYYDEHASIIKQIKDISKDIPQEYNVADLLEKKARLLNIFKNEDSVVDPALMKNNRDKIIAEIKSIQGQITDIRDRFNADTLRVKPNVKAALKQALSLLAQISHKEPTSFYLDEINEHMSAMDQTALNTDTAVSFLKDKSLILRLKTKHKRFAEWFNENHIVKESINQSGEIYTSIQRVDSWSNSRASETEDTTGKYIISTTVTYNGKDYPIEGAPNHKYSFVVVKDEFRTIPKGLTSEQRAKYVGTVIDNKGQMLPLNRDQFIQQGREVDPTYINEAYYKLIENQDKKKLLEAIHKFHLESQTDLDSDQKLYMDVPRFAMHENLELLKSGRGAKRISDKFKSIGKGIAATLRGDSREQINEASKLDIDDPGEHVNPEFEDDYERINLIKDGMLNPVLDKIPLRGINKIPIEDVSYDVLSSLSLYAFQAEKQRVLNEIAPAAQALMATLENLDIGTEKTDATRQKTGIVKDITSMFTGKKGTANRLKAMKALYNREFKGSSHLDSQLDWVNKVTSALTTGASINYFALNIPSAIKNYWGILWQMNIEAIAGEYFDFKSMGKGKVRSKQALHEWSTKIWGGNFESLNTHMMLYFDPIQGKAEESTGKDASRSYKKDLASLSLVYSPRKYMEMEGGLQLFFSMMYHKKLEQTINGQTSLISYADAFEMIESEDGTKKMQLKAGIDKSYEVGGKGFHNFQAAVHEKFKDLNGVFSKFDKPQAQAYFAYKLFIFMRNYFTSMFMNRFGKERANFALGVIRTGYYVESVKAIGKIMISMGAHINELAPSEKRAMFKTMADIAQILIISAIAALLFGYDDDDEDRFAKLRAKSGALGSDDFKLTGWLSNHLLTLLLKTQSENQSFIPIGQGLNNYLNLTNTTSVAFGPTITAWGKLINDVAHHAMPGDDERLYYKRDTGPYPWQKEGEAKIWNHFFTMAGFSGSQTDPVKGIESWSTYAH